VRIAATTERPDLSFRLADATLNSYIDTIVANDVRQSDSAVTFFEGQVATAKADRDAALTTLNDFLVQNNVSGAADTPLSLQLEAENLRSEFTRLDTIYTSKIDSLDQAKLASSTAKTEVQQRLRITDTPQEPTAPEPRLRKATTTLLIFAVLGLMLSLASVIVAATLDRTIRVPGDITAKFDLDVLAVVPDARAR
jgi:uncharacterized protein involved in exopolysaccharide biosynthesis